MSDVLRKKSPRAPSLPLNEALERALRIYDKERRHTAPTDVIAQDLGYKSANNGAALAAIASLRSFGLLQKAADGKLAVAKSVETYKFTPEEDRKRELQIQWLKTPAVFANLLAAYSSGLPSDATIRLQLIQQGFNPASAESVLAAFKQSVDFTKYFDGRPALSHPELQNNEFSEPETNSSSAPAETTGRTATEVTDRSSFTHDRIPVRLSGGRRAWLEIPSPFFSADKKRLKAQIDLLLAEDDDDSII